MKNIKIEDIVSNQILAKVKYIDCFENDKDLILDKIIEIINSKNFDEVCISFANSLFSEGQVKYIRNRIAYNSCYHSNNDNHFLELY